MIQAALYARVSTEMQEKERTIDSQLAVVTQYAEAHDFRTTPALTYTDEGYSGSQMDRPALDELRDHARQGRFDVVVILCPDRLARRYPYQVLLLEELKSAGIEVHFCERPISDSPDDQLLLQIQGVIAEYERAKILERARRGRLHRARMGELGPGELPYGYCRAAKRHGGDGRIRLHEEETAMVRQVFAWYDEEDVSIYTVAHKLNDSQWGARRGQWSLSTVDRMLRLGASTEMVSKFYGLTHQEVALRRDIHRLPVFGLGCAGGVIGLSHAAALARAAPDSRVLFLVVELCALTFRHGDNSNSNIVASALFGDGAAAALVGCAGEGPALGPAGAHTWPGSLDVMGWNVAEDGLGVQFSRDIPGLIRAEFRAAAAAFLERHGLGLADIDRPICHPGGAKVLDALEAAFALPRGAMTEARSVLRDYGNMSAATVLFVLERALANGAAGRLLLSALGPGFTAGFQVLEAA